jgi:hypothetical protein
MLAPDPTFIEFKEYKANLNERLDEASLNTGELYSVMLELEPNKNREAAKLPVKILNRRVMDFGLQVVEMVMCDKDLQPYLEVEGTFEDGFWTNVGKQISLTDRKNDKSKYRPAEAYIHSYSDGIDGEFLVMQSVVRIGELAEV